MKRHALGFLASASALLTAASVHAGECISYDTGPQVIAELGIEFDDAVLHTGHLFGVNADGLTVLDVSTPASPAVVTTVGLGITGGKVAVGDDVVWSASEGVLRGIDVAVPGAPVVVSTIATPDIHNVALDGSRLVLVSRFELQLFDVTNPASPVDVGTVTAPSYFRGLAAAGGIAYVGSDPWPNPHELLVFDITGPSPQLVSSLPMGFATNRNFDRLVVSDDALYISSLSWSDPCMYGEPILVVDVSSPLSPSIVDEIGDYVPNHFAVRDDRIEVYQGLGLDVVDMQFESVEGEARLSKAVAWSAFENGHVFTNAGVIAGSDVDSPRPLGNLPGIDERGLDFVTSGDFIYVLGAPTVESGFPCGNYDSRVYALDTSVAWGFQLETSWNAFGGNGRSMLAEGDRLFTFGGFFSAHGGDRGGSMAIYDLNTHPAPYLGRYDTSPAQLFDGAVSGNYAYLLLEQGTWTLRVVDITDPAAFVDVTTIPVADLSVAVQRIGSTLYIGRRSSPGADIYDISDPASPVLVGSHPYSAIGVIDGTTLYTEGSELRRLDISDPLSPVSLALADITGAGRVSLNDGMVYWSSTFDGLSVLDAATLTVRDGTLPISGPVTFIDEGVLAYGFEELRVYPLSCAAAVAVEDPAPQIAARTRAVPNPFRARTTLSFATPPLTSPATVTIVDVSGRLVRRIDVDPAGSANVSVEWDGVDHLGRRVAAGVYYYGLDRTAAHHRLVVID